MNDKKIFSILVCPLCKSSLEYQAEPPQLICKAEKLAFPIQNGIPLLLESDAVRVPHE